MSKKASEVFEEAVAAADHLELKAGLKALKAGEGKDRIHKGRGPLLGSVNIDDDCTSAFPTGSRWDYVIGVEVNAKAKAFYVEVHSAETSEVSTMKKKLTWLLDFMNGESQKPLRKLAREIHWVASGRVNIPVHTPQYKSLKAHPLSLLVGPKQRLDLP